MRKNTLSRDIENLSAEVARLRDKHNLISDEDEPLTFAEKILGILYDARIDAIINEEIERRNNGK